MGKGTSFNERDGYRPAGTRPISSPSSGNNSGVFIEQDKYELVDSPPLLTNTKSNNSGVLNEIDVYIPDIHTLHSGLDYQFNNNDNVFIFFEKDTDIFFSGINPITNNYPVNYPPSGEQVITDAILTTTGEYIDVGDNFYLSF